MISLYVDRNLIHVADELYNYSHLAIQRIVQNRLNPLDHSVRNYLVYHNRPFRISPVRPLVRTAVQYRLTPVSVRFES